MGNVEKPFICITPGSTMTGVVVLDMVKSMGYIEQFMFLTVCKQMADVELNY